MNGLHRKCLRMFAAGSLFAAVLMLSGCFTLSVNPLYSGRDVVSDPGLLGVWGDPEESEGETWQFLAGEGGSMRLVIREEDSLRINPERDGLMIATLVELGGTTYLDLYPEEPEGVNEIFLGHVVPAHSFWKIERNGDTLTLYILETTRLEEGIEQGSIDVDHFEQEGLLVLTAPVAELQDLVIRNSDLLFVDGQDMKRIQ